MKELHNHIFSNTTCISKETMLRYINKQLSKKELYEVEKHMLDCELCSDAFEGMKMATNSSILFAIDSKIDFRAGGGTKKSSVMRNLMVAASVAIIAFGTYFTVTNFGDKLAQHNLAANDNPTTIEKELAPENFINNKANKKEALAKGGLTAEEPVLEDNENTIVTDAVVADKDVEVASAEIIKVQAEYFEVLDEVELYEVEDEVAIVESEATVNNRLDSDNSVESTVTRTESLSTIEMGDVAPIQEQEKARQKVKDRSSNAKKSTRNVPSAASQGASVSGNTSYKLSNTYDLYSYKVYDYAAEYQNEYEFKKSVEQEVMSSDYETKFDKNKAKEESLKNTVEITYKQTLESGIKALKNNNYQMAINQFELILKSHPKDINALFYGGISFYNLADFNASKDKFDLVLVHDNKMFNQEAKWYKAKSLIGLNKTIKAKTILQQIIDENGFYKSQAIEKMKEL